MTAPNTRTHESLLCRAAELLAYGILPIENWSNIFANPEYADKPGLQAKAFCVWFPTQIDFLNGRAESREIKDTLDEREVSYSWLFERSEALELCFRNILKMYTPEEQIYIRDRRLQYVHGKLDLYTRETHRIKVFIESEDRVIQLEWTPDDYREIMATFYSDMAGSTATLRAKLLDSDSWKELYGLYSNTLVVQDHLLPLFQELGISANAGSH